MTVNWHALKGSAVYASENGMTLGCGAGNIKVPQHENGKPSVLWVA